MLTKEKILISAVKLFNKKGFHSITLRGIAKQAQISHGNLTYHYKNKGIIAEKLHQKMLSELSQEFENYKFSESPSIAIFLKILALFHKFQQRYAFLFLDTAEVFRQNESLSNLYQEHLRNWKKEIKSNLSILHENYLLSFQDNTDLENLGETIWLDSIFSLQLYLTFDKSKNNNTDFLIERVKKTIQPFLPTKTTQLNLIEVISEEESKKKKTNKVAKNQIDLIDIITQEEEKLFNATPKKGKATKIVVHQPTLF